MDHLSPFFQRFDPFGGLASFSDQFRWVYLPTEVEEPELDYLSWVPQVTGPSSGHVPPLLVGHVHVIQTEGVGRTCLIH